MLSNGYPRRTTSDSWKLLPRTLQPNCLGVGVLWVSSTDGELHYTDSLGIDYTIDAGSVREFQDGTHYSLAIGTSAGANLPSNSVGNILIGHKAGESITTGIENIAVGTSAFRSRVSAKYGVAIGHLAGELNTAEGNTFIGVRSAKISTTGSNNTCCGKFSFLNLSTGYQNTALGALAGNSVTTQEHSTSIGYNSSASHDYAITLGAGTTSDAIRELVVGGTTSSSVNVIRNGNNGLCDLGRVDKKFKDIYLQGTCKSEVYEEKGVLGELPKTGLGGTANLLTGSDYSSITTAFDNTAYGDNSLNGIVNGSLNTAVGTDSALNLSSGSDNTLIGAEAGINLTESVANTLIGSMCGTLLTGSVGANRNVAVGYNALSTAITSVDNTAVGTGAGFTCTTSYNTLLGTDANTSGTGDYGIAIGYNTETVSKTCVIGSSTLAESVTSIRPGYDGNCDLGSSSKQFQTLYLSKGPIFPKPFYEVYVENNTTATTCTTQNTWYVVAYASGLVTDNAENKDFTSDATTNIGRITYNGTVKKAFHTGCTISCYPASNLTRNWQFALFKNGVIIPGSTTELTTTDNASRFSTTIHSIPVLDTNDYIELYTRCTSANSEDITITYSNYFGLALPNDLGPP